MSGYEINNYKVDTWSDGRGHNFVHLEIEGLSVSEGLYGLSDVSETLSPVDAIAIGAALRKAGLKALKK